jgi:predicted kinase
MKGVMGVMSQPHLILVCGFAGSGKTYVATELARRCRNASYVDKDTVTRPLTEALLFSYGMSPHDRESETYLTRVRPLEYQSLVDHYEELLQMEKDVIVSAPFLAEVVSASWLEQTRRILKTIRARRSIVWVKSDPQTQRDRLLVRGAKRDEYKLDHWSEYSKKLEPAVPANLASESIIFDNSRAAATGWEEQITALAERLNLIV